MIEKLENSFNKDFTIGYLFGFCDVLVKMVDPKLISQKDLETYKILKDGYFKPIFLVPYDTDMKLKEEK